MVRKISLEEIKIYFNDQNCEYLEENWVGSKNKFKYKCSCGNIAFATWGNFSRGKRCNKCGLQKRVESRRYSQEEVSEKFSSRGFTLIGEYTGYHDPVAFRCPEGHEHSTRLADFERYTGCAVCSGVKKKTYDEIKQYFENNGCELLENEIRFEEQSVSKGKLKYICSCGKEWRTSWGKFLQGRRCKECGQKKYSESRKHDQDYVLNNFQKRGVYCYLSIRLSMNLLNICVNVVKKPRLLWQILKVDVVCVIMKIFL